MEKSAHEVLARILSYCIEGDREIDLVKMCLAEEETFDPEIAFFRFDRDRKGQITTADIVQFLKENGIELTERDAALFIRPFDDDCNGKLSYIEFMYAFVSGRPEYRDLVVQRLSKKPKAAINYISCNGTLKFETEFFI